MAYAEKAAKISMQPENHEGENWDEVMMLCAEADIEIKKLKDDLQYHKAMDRVVGELFKADEKRIASLEDDLLKANDICVAKTRDLIARIKELERQEK